MLNFFKRVRPDWRTFISSLLIVFSFPPWGYSFLIWIALIPWFAALERTRDSRNSWKAFQQGVWLSFFMSLFGFYWVAYVLREFSGMPWSLCILAFLIYCLAGQTQFLIFAPLYREIRKR